MRKMKAGVPVGTASSHASAEALISSALRNGFFQNAGQWIDSETQKLPDAKRVRVQFGSADYFDLLKEHPETAPWLALGTRVQFVLDKAVYEIYEADAAGQK